jgi:hypothetical protein
MEQAAKTFYQSIKTFADLQKLINEGESESVFLECKSPTTPSLSSDLRKTLARTISGFSNTNGGVIIWGVSTTKKFHSGLDVITQVEPIGNCIKFQREIENRISTLTTPPIHNYENKIIKKKPKDTRGVIITFIPKFSGDPIQSVEDDHFYFRSGDEFIKTPYEMLKRLFAATESPDLYLSFESSIMKRDESGTYNIPMILSNNSSAIAEKIKLFVVIDNIYDCEIFSIPGFRDVTEINPQYPKAMSYDLEEYIYKGLSMNIGNISVKLKGSKKILKFKSTIYAHKMVPKEFFFRIFIAKSKLKVQRTSNTTKLR